MKIEKAERRIGKKVGVIGLGYIGLPLLAVLADVGYSVLGMDINKERIDRLSKHLKADIYEPNLDETLEKHGKYISFTDSLENLAASCETIMVTVGTPLASNNFIDLNQVNGIIDPLGRNLKKGQLLILKSTLTPGSTRQIAAELQKISGLEAGRDFYVAFCPERTVEGDALNELKHLPKIIGGINEASTERAAEVFSAFGAEIIRVSCPEVAELCKLIDNTYRALNIAFANEIGEVCEKLGIDSYEVAFASNKSYNRTNLFKAALGAGGPCLSKDPQILESSSRNLNLNPKVIGAVVSKNKESTIRVASVITAFLKEKQVEKPVIGILGLAFKGRPETDDTRCSPATVLYNLLKEDLVTAEFKFYDPLVVTFLNNPVCRTIEEAIKDCHAVVFLTDHPSLCDKEADHIISNAGRPLIVADCWHNLIHLEKVVRDNDVEIFRIGDGRLRKS